MVSDSLHKFPEKLYLFMKAEHLLSCLENDEIKVALPKDCNDPFELIPRGQQTQPDNTDGIGFICLSEECTSSTMWAHYADKHRGVCLEFDFMIESKEDFIEVESEATTKLRMKAALLSMKNKQQREQFAISDLEGNKIDKPVLMKVKYHPYRAYHARKAVYINKMANLAICHAADCWQPRGRNGRTRRSGVFLLPWTNACPTMMAAIS